MAAIISHEASPSTSRWSYEAYVSFHGEDTRKSFVHHLHHALVRNGLRTFRDGYDLKRGESIMLQLQKAIEGSRVSIIVLSKNYANSRWCLEELLFILKCRSSRHLVIPFFYDVDPSDVRNQTGSFEEVFMRHERRIETEMGEQKEYLKGKVQDWRMALKEVASLSGFVCSANSFKADESRIIQLVRRLAIRIEIVTSNNRAHPGRLDQRDFYASRLEDERTRGKRSRDEISSHVFSLDILRQHFGNKREDVAKSLGISVSTLKRHCRCHGIFRWPNRIRNNVSGLPIPYGEKNPLPTFNTLSTNGQIQMENEVGGQNLEPDECLPDSFEDPNFQNTRIGSIAEFDKTPTLSDSVPDHCRDANFCISAVYSESEAAGGSSESVFQLQGQTTQSTAYSNRNALVLTQPQIASEEVLNENGGSSEDRRDLLASQAEAILEGNVSECTNSTFFACSDAAALYQAFAMMPNELPHDYFVDPSFLNTEHDSIVGTTPTYHDSFLSTYHGVDFCISSVHNELEGQTTQFPACPTPNVSPLQIPPTEVPSGNMGSSEDSRILLASQEALLEGHVFESNNLTVLSCPDAAAPSRLLANNIHTMPTYPHMAPHLIGGSSESTYPNHSGLVDPPHPQRASTQIPSENTRTLEDLSESINPTIPSCSNPTPSQQLMMPPLIASQDTNSVRVKATNGPNIIAFNLSFASGIIQLKEEVSKRGGFELGNFNLKYMDADGDLVSIACDDDVRDYLQLLTSKQVSILLVS